MYHMKIGIFLTGQHPPGSDMVAGILRSTPLRRLGEPNNSMMAPASAK